MAAAGSVLDVAIGVKFIRKLVLRVALVGAKILYKIGYFELNLPV